MATTDALPGPHLDQETERIDQLAREVLRESYSTYDVEKLELTEDASGVNVKVVLRRARVSGDGASNSVEVSGRGVGLVDAFYDGIMGAWANEFASLRTISLADFVISAGFDDAKGRKSDALAVATIKVKNAHGVTCSFERKTPSVTRSCLLVALDAVTFFVNAERAYVQLQLAMKDATERRRSDLVDRYRQQMGTIVQATSYAELPRR